MGRLDKKVAVITGGAGGIGRAAGKLFVEEGADVLLVDLDEEALAAAVQEIGSNRISYFVADVTSQADNQAMIATAAERYGGVDVLLANAGIEGDVAPLVQYDEARFDQVIGVNVKGVFLGIKSAVPPMMERGGGSIVITSSVAGVKGSAGIGPYCASKHAVIGLMKSAAQEYAGANIRVNSVNPSPVETRMMRSLEEGIAPGDSERIKSRMASAIPLKRYGEPEEIAKVMLFLASDESSWVTGSVQMADGGMTA
ncbi:MAG: oxidoreductase [Gammaproteobacteria bacterium]|nr:oxidoreductase [Gammaproteobacteria bacterium]